MQPGTLSDLTGMSPSTVQRHIEMVCKYLNKTAPKKISKVQIERGKKELLAIKGLGESAIEKLFRAGITDASSFLTADPQKVADGTGIAVQKIKDYQATLQKKRDTAIIQI
jgi:DNA topoisomerase-1